MAFSTNRLFSLTCLVATAFVLSSGSSEAAFIQIAAVNTAHNTSTFTPGSALYTVDGFKSQDGRSFPVIDITPTPTAFGTTVQTVDIADLKFTSVGTSTAPLGDLDINLTLVGAFAGSYHLLVPVVKDQAAKTLTFGQLTTPLVLHGNGSATLTIDFNKLTLSRASGGNPAGTLQATLTQHVPEPTSLALLGMGSVGAAFGAYRRRRASRNTAV